MIDISRVVSNIEEIKGKVVELARNIFYSLELYEEKIYAVNYYIIIDDLVEFSNNFQELQIEIISETYYNQTFSGDIRWNHYLYCIVPRERVEGDVERFYDAKRKIELNFEYARKRVLFDDELYMLKNLNLEQNFQAPADLSTYLKTELDKNRWGFILDRSLSVEKTVQMILEGAKKDIIPLGADSHLNLAERTAASAFIKKLRIERFRPYPNKSVYEFGRVNLIFGNNGTGKTSLCEAIEYLYCGKNMRFPSELKNVIISAQLFDSDLTLSMSDKFDIDKLYARNKYWYGKDDVHDISLGSNFGKFNFFATDTAIRMSIDRSRLQINDEVSRLLLGIEVEHLSTRVSKIQQEIEKRLLKYDVKLSLLHKMSTKISQRVDHFNNSIQKCNSMQNMLYENICSITSLKIVNKSLDIICFKDKILNILALVNAVEAAGHPSIRIESLLKRKEKLSFALGQVSELINEGNACLEKLRDIYEKAGVLVHEKYEKIFTPSYSDIDNTCSIKNSADRYDLLSSYVYNEWELRDKADVSAELKFLLRVKLYEFYRNLNNKNACFDDAGEGGSDYTTKLPKQDGVALKYKTLNNKLREDGIDKEFFSEVDRQTLQLENRLKAIKNKAIKIAFRSGINGKVSIKKIIPKLQRKINGIDDTLESLQNIFLFADKVQTKDVSEVKTILENVCVKIDNFSKLIAESDQIQVNISLAENDFNNNKSQIKQICVEKNKLKFALKNIQSIHTKSQLSLNEEIVKENADIINKFFTEIHNPSEFFISASSKHINIIRKTTGKSIGLDEMSTGQRSAYALSLFIAMNLRLNTCPPVMIFDDPISQIDDLNSLSFLDKLREIAIYNNRQLFFATANHKLAGLIRHKFSFLGSNDFVEINLSRSE